MSTGFVVLYVYGPRVVLGTVACYDGELKFLPGRETKEPYTSRFQNEIVDPLQGRQLRNPFNGRTLGPQDVALGQNHKDYGTAFEQEVGKKKFDGQQISCFADI